MRLGLSSYTFGWAVGVPGHPPARPLDELGLLERARTLGVSLLQLGDNLPLPTFEPARRAAFIARAAQLGVEIELGARGLTPERVAQYANLARAARARLVRFVIDDADYLPDAKAVTAILREAAPALGELTLAIENHDRFTAVELRAIIEKAGSERIGVCLDTANSLGAGEGLEAVVAVLAPLTVNLHLKDFWIERMPSQMGFTVTGRPAGAGRLNVPALVEQVAKFRRCRTAILELWTPPEAALEQTIAKEAAWAAQSLKYLRPLFD